MSTASLDQRARVAGERWAGEVRRQIRQQNRRASGGWPGTMSEARALVTDSMLSSSDDSEAFGARSRGDRERAARAVYRSARAWWIQRQEVD